MVAHLHEIPKRHNPLIVTSDPMLLDDLLRITADLGIIADVAPDATAARGWFERASMVLVGIDVAESCARANLGRRGDVVLIGRDQDAGPIGHHPRAWALADRLGATHIATLPTAESWLLGQLGDVDDAAAGIIVAVLGGRGGAGASVLAGGLAVTAARRGMTTLLVDADPLGGGADLVLGWEHRKGLRWPALSGAGGHVHPSVLVDALPGGARRDHGPGRSRRRCDLVVLSWDRGEPTTASTEAMIAALDAGRRGRDIVVVDLPRWLEEPAAIALSRADRAYLVVPAELRACAAAARVAAIALSHCNELYIVVRQPSPGGLSVSEVADAVRLPLAGAFDTEPGLSAALERGEAPTSNGRGSLTRLCEKLLADLDSGLAQVAA